MIKRSRHIEQWEDLNIFQSFTDLISNAFMILSLLLLLAFLQAQYANKKLEYLNKRLQSASPIVIDEKSGQFKFSSGSAELNTELKQHIEQNIVSKIAKIVEEREIDFIQVIGHTDGQEINRISNLDKTLEKVANSGVPVSQLIPGSNADLGLMRALAVVQELQKSQNLKQLKFRAYSAAQLYLPSGEIALLNRQADENRRRIEIRFIPPAQQQ
jgi:outer membrane protein OmpA-like peptidoglycan-associated protein